MAKRKPKSNFKRNPSQREPYDRILIVCEGEKTEPIYFKSLIDWYKINTANVSITGDCGSNPNSVFKKAKEEQKKDKHKNAYDKIFCVFDKDSHPNYLKTIALVNASKNYKAIVSVPCFEYWVLLHFEYTDAPFSKTGSKSICDMVVKKLKVHLPDYQKSATNLVENALLNNIDNAIKRSKKSTQSAKERGSDNPSSNVHELVECLKHIKDRSVT